LDTVEGFGGLILSLAYDWSEVVANTYAIIADIELGQYESAGISVGALFSIAFNFQI
jgi:hypothetical protein